MGKKIILFVPSYVQIPGMLYFIEKHKFDSEINIYVCAKDLYKFIVYFNNNFWSNKIKCFHIKNPYFNSGANIIINYINYIKYLCLINKTKIRLYNKYFKNKKGYKVYFFTKDYFTRYNYEAYYIKKLSSNNYIYLLDMAPLAPKTRKILFKEYTLRGLIINLADKFIFDKHLELFRSTENSDMAHMSKTYIKKYVNCEMDYAHYAKDVNKSYNKYSRRLSSKYAKYRMIFFDQPLYNSDIFFLQSGQKVFFKKLIEVFIKYFGEKFAIKYHPENPKNKHTLNFNNIKSENILEQFIPGEYFYNENTKYYISFLSNTITDELNCTRPNNIRISLLYLVPFKEECIRENLINEFRGRIKGTVLFPKSIAELENIFKDEMM